MEEKYLTVRSAVLVPLLQAVVTGIFIGGTFGGAIWILNDLADFYIAPWAVGMTVGFLACVRAWTRLLEEWRRFLYGLEPEIRPMMAEPQQVRVTIAENEGRTMQFIDLPADYDQLLRLGKGLTQGKGFTEAQWTGKGQPFTRNQFVQLRDEMVVRGLVVWNSDLDPARGARVTGKGKAVMRHFASMSNSPTLQLEKR